MNQFARITLSWEYNVRSRAIKFDTFRCRFFNQYLWGKCFMMLHSLAQCSSKRNNDYILFEQISLSNQADNMLRLALYIIYSLVCPHSVRNCPEWRPPFVGPPPG